MAHHSHSLLKKAHLFADISARQKTETPYIAPVQYCQQQFQSLAPDLSNRGHCAPGLPQSVEVDDISRMMIADALVYLPQDILTKVDRASMAHSLEVRAPFLDRKVVELAFSLPRAWHRRMFHGKRMLRRAFPHLLPPVIWKRRKQGFAVPVNSWFRGDMGAGVMSLLNQSDLPLNGPAVQDLLRQHELGKRDHGYRLWALYTYLLWRERRVPLASAAHIDQPEIRVAGEENPLICRAGRACQEA
jgi:asparagine synthase (glutamine-hydrolysing)